MNTTELLIANALETAKQLRELQESPVADAIFESIVENENGKEIQFERPISDLAFAALLKIEALVEALEIAQATAANSNRGWREAHEQEARAESAEKRVAELEESRDHYRAAYQAEEQSKQNMMLSFNAELCELLPGCQYMDPPDGGSVTPMEQVRRMVEDYRQRIAELEGRTVNLPKPIQVNLTGGEYVNAWTAYTVDSAIRATGIKCEVKG